MMEYREEDFLMLSGIQHYSFCKRQWALIHIEQQWAENARTVTGELLHKKAHDPFVQEKRGDLIVSRGLQIHSKSLGISGICDIVEFRADENGICLHGRCGTYLPYPIEYKKGIPKQDNADILQLTAQVMCLEEMFSVSINKGALFYWENRKRDEIDISQELRDRVRHCFDEMHQLYRRQLTPKAKWTKSCNACSLAELCMPGLEHRCPVREYIEKSMRELDE